MGRLATLATRCTNNIESLEAAYDVAQHCLEALEVVGLEEIQPRGDRFEAYRLLRHTDSTGEHWLRPLNTSLFIRSAKELTSAQELSLQLLDRIAHRTDEAFRLPVKLQRFADEHGLTRVLYTTVQAIGCILDLTVPPQAARKNFGTRFEEIVVAVLDRSGVPNCPLTLTVPVPALGARYRALLDRVISAQQRESDKATDLSEGDIVVSIKTSSKDRMKLVFLDRLLLRRLLRRPKLRYIALYHNDVQRAGRDGISQTFVPNMFLVCSKVLGDLTGVYYLDPPQAEADERFRGRLRSFEDLLLRDIWALLHP